MYTIYHLFDQRQHATSTYFIIILYGRLFQERMFQECTYKIGKGQECRIDGIGQGHCSVGFFRSTTFESGWQQFVHTTRHQTIHHLFHTTHLCCKQPQSFPHVNCLLFLFIGRRQRRGYCPRRSFGRICIITLNNMRPYHVVVGLWNSSGGLVCFGKGRPEAVKDVLPGCVLNDIGWLQQDGYEFTVSKRYWICCKSQLCP